MPNLPSRILRAVVVLSLLAQPSMAAVSFCTVPRALATSRAGIASFNRQALSAQLVAFFKGKGSRQATLTGYRRLKESAQAKKIPLSVNATKANFGESYSIVAVLATAMIVAIAWHLPSTWDDAYKTLNLLLFGLAGAVATVIAGSGDGKNPQLSIEDQQLFEMYLKDPNAWHSRDSLSGYRIDVGNASEANLKMLFLEDQDAPGLRKEYRLTPAGKSKILSVVRSVSEREVKDIEKTTSVAPDSASSLVERRGVLVVQKFIEHAVPIYQHTFDTPAFPEDLTPTQAALALVHIFTEDREAFDRIADAWVAHVTQEQAVLGERPRLLFKDGVAFARDQLVSVNWVAPLAERERQAELAEIELREALMTIQRFIHPKNQIELTGRIQSLSELQADQIGKMIEKFLKGFGYQNVKDNAISVDRDLMNARWARPVEQIPDVITALVAVRDPKTYPYFHMERSRTALRAVVEQAEHGKYVANLLADVGFNMNDLEGTARGVLRAFGYRPDAVVGATWEAEYIPSVVQDLDDLLDIYRNRKRAHQLAAWSAIPMQEMTRALQERLAAARPATTSTPVVYEKHVNIPFFVRNDRMAGDYLAGNDDRKNAILSELISQRTVMPKIVAKVRPFKWAWRRRVEQRIAKFILAELSNDATSVGAQGRALAAKATSPRLQEILNQRIPTLVTDPQVLDVLVSERDHSKAGALHAAKARIEEQISIVTRARQVEAEMKEDASKSASPTALPEAPIQLSDLLDNPSEAPAVDKHSESQGVVPLLLLGAAVSSIDAVALPFVFVVGYLMWKTHLNLYGPVHRAYLHQIKSAV
jgi:hypothetical protein